jgi:hypothetical protein
MRHINNLILVFALFLTFQGAWAETVYVEPTKGASVPDSDRATVEELIRIAVTQIKGHTNVSSPASADLSLSSKVMKLGDAYVLSIEKKDKNGKTLFSEKMKAKEMGEMDTVATRLTQAVLENSKVISTADVTNVTQEEETMNTRRFQATRQWIIGLGPGWSSELNSKGGGFTFVLGYLWGLDPDFGVNLSYTINSGPSDDDSSFSDFSLGGEYYFSRTKNSPFVGARMGYGSATANDCDLFAISCVEDDASGWSVNGTVGYKFFRTSSVNVAIYGSFFYLFDRTSNGHPSLSTVQFVVYY